MTYTMLQLHPSDGVQTRKLLSLLESIVDGEGNILHSSENLSKISAAYRKRGMDIKRADYYAKLLIDGWNSVTHSLQDKLWAIGEGFLPEMLYIGVDQDNYTDWLPSETYFLLHPLNNFFQFWVNDKVTLKYMFQNCLASGSPQRRIDVMPKCYLYIENDGRYSYLMDAPVSVAKDSDFLLSLLRHTGELAAKPSNGAGGIGFVHLSYEGDMIRWNGVTVSTQEFMRRAGEMKGYIVTEFIRQHHDLNHIYPGSACTLRIIAVKNQDDPFRPGEISVISSYARFGAHRSGSASNLSSGGIGVSIEWETGIMAEAGYGFPRFYGANNRFERHPDTGFIFGGCRFPNWETVKSGVVAVCSHLSSLEFFGLDIIVTDNGFRICEINTLPSLDFDQIFSGPIRLNSDASRYFTNKITNYRKKYEKKDY